MPLLNPPDINISGPLWTAKATVLSAPVEAPTSSGAPNINSVLHARNLYLNRPPKPVQGSKAEYLPGTTLVLCAVQSVRIQPKKGFVYEWKRAPGELPPVVTEADLLDGKQSGALALLLLVKNNDATKGSVSRSYTCVGGEINLSNMVAQTNALNKLYGALDLLPPGSPPEGRWALSVHASGVSISGRAPLPWSEQRVPLALLLHQALPTKGDPDPAGLRLVIEAERLSDDEARTLILAWQDFSRYLNPKNPLLPGPEDAAAPTWVTLEVADPLSVPRLYWRIEAWQASPPTLPLYAAESELNLLISDQQVYNADFPPTSLAQINLRDVPIDGGRDDGITLSILSGDPVTSPTVLEYRWGAEQNERFEFTNMTVAFSAVETPELLRDVQRLAVPLWFSDVEPVPLVPPVIWGFMPLEEGWAQLPVPNLTEQIYVDSEVTQLDREALPEVERLLQGAVSIGNTHPAVLESHPDEHAWNTTIINAAHIHGTWRLVFDVSRFELDEIELTVVNPEVVMNGMFWLSRGYPTVEDALPTLDDWLGSVESIPLATLQAADLQLFPPAMRVELDAFKLTLRDLSADDAEPASATLTDWAFTYNTNPDVLLKLVTAGVLPVDLFSRYLPLVWRRHPRLPMIQALPLTQTAVPPSYPNASRQFVPFQLPVDEASLSGEGGIQVDINLPLNWRFGVQGTQNGAAQFPVLLDGAIEACEWAQRFDLPLVALSLPGLIADPHTSPGETGIPEDNHLGLPLQYRHDLPYTDQLNALAQLPQQPRDPELSSPLPDAPPEEQPAPLVREDYAEFWKKLSTQASLAALAAVDAFARKNGIDALYHLVEPFKWPVQTKLDLESYPGNLQIEDPSAGPNGTLRLSEVDALEGISGTFDVDDTGNLQYLPDEIGANGHYHITAGSAAAYRDPTTGEYRDQRGLLRKHTTQDADLLHTPVRLNAEIGQFDSYDLVSTLSSLELQVSESSTWNFWFRDLPVQENVFDREKTRSDAAQGKDVNDPEALTREFNYLNGYEWRLGEAGDALYLPLDNLHFYPLTLEEVLFDVAGVQSLAIIGRLQLPLPDTLELEDLSNAVKLTFTRDSDGLALNAVELVSEMGEWPLALTNGELTSAPLLLWENITLSDTGLTIGGLWLHFFLFDVEWSLNLDDLVFPAEVPAAALEIHYTFPVDETDAIAPHTALLTIDLAGDPPSKLHHVDLNLRTQLGRRRLDGLVARYTFVQGEDKNIVYDVSDSEQPLHLTIKDPDRVEWLPDGGLRINQPALIISETPATALIDAAKQTNELTLEAWIKPTSSVQTGPARILSLSSTPFTRNFMLGQGLWGNLPVRVFNARLRTTDGGPKKNNGEPEVVTPDNTVTDELISEIVQLVFKRDITGQAVLYLNGVEVARGEYEGTFENWDSTMCLMLGNEATKNRPWLGEFYLINVYNRALTEAEIAQSYSDFETTSLLQLSDTPRPAFSADICFTLPPQAGAETATEEFSTTWENGCLFDDITLSEDLRSLSYTDHALQFSFTSYVEDQMAAQLELLPGMPVTAPWIPGFAVATFDVLSTIRLDSALSAGLDDDNAQVSGALRAAFTAHALPLAVQVEVDKLAAGRKWRLSDGSRNYLLISTGKDLLVQRDVPLLLLKSAFVEMLIACRWGEFLQDETNSADALMRGFGSSAGDLVLNYSAQWLASTNTWSETYLLNGVLEVKNLISWPTTLLPDGADPSLLQLPPVEVGQEGAFSHMRHTIRVLFNQQEIPSDIMVIGGENLVFRISSRNAWQFLAVVEHQLIDVRPNGDFTDFAIDNDRRWTALQEVRLLRPNTFTNFLKSFDDTNFQHERWVNQYGYLGEDLRALLAGGLNADLAQLEGPTLIVEASAPHWVRLDPIPQIGATNLQFLPNGSQLAILSAPEDYAPSSPADPRWLLLTMPFLGRLQPQPADGLQPGESISNQISGLQIDPVLQLYRTRAHTPDEALPPVLLVLSQHAPAADPLETRAAVFDGSAGHRFMRLDPLSLEENWLRLQNPPSETLPDILHGIMAALPDTPARLSRSATLQAAFSEFRQTDLAENELLPASLTDQSLVWRRDSLFVLQGTNTAMGADSPPYSWHLVGLQLAALPSTEDTPVKRFPAVTVLPVSVPRTLIAYTVKSGDNLIKIAQRFGTTVQILVELNEIANPDMIIVGEVLLIPVSQGSQPPTDTDEWKFPVTLSISPYLGLQYHAAGAITPRLIYAELLCIDRGTKTLRSAASQLYDLVAYYRDKQTAANLPVETDEDNIDFQKLADEIRLEGSLIWAKTLHQRLAPESPVAVLRFRTINSTDSTARLTATYFFGTISDIVVQRRLAKRVFRARSAVNQLRFRQGQYGGWIMPDDVRPFELAPPQMRGVQPVYLPEQPANAQQPWPWGFSGLRLSVQYSDQQGGIFGDVQQDNMEADMVTLWWQALQHAPQFRSTVGDARPAAGLPELFRAPAIKSLLPVLPALPLPRINPASRFSNTPNANGDGTNGDSPLPRWQPVLPGAMRYLLTGSRPGAMFALRGQILRQSGLEMTDQTAQVGQALTSGSIPVQHRIPRPVPLPPNTRPEYGLQTWASRFSPQEDLLLTKSPADEAFFAPCGDDPMRRMRLVLLNPPAGVIPVRWNGDVVFEVTTEKDLPDAGSKWLRLELVQGSSIRSYQMVVDAFLLFSVAAGQFPSELDSGNLPGTIRDEFAFAGNPISDAATVQSAVLSSGKTYWIIEDEDDYFSVFEVETELRFYYRDSFRWFRFKLDQLGGDNDQSISAAPGERFLVRAAVLYKENAVQDFKQILEFPLRPGLPGRLPLPLTPRFVHFEDPEYNRRLASPSANAARQVPSTITDSNEKVLYSVGLAADRREYNPDSELSVRYDWQDAPVIASEAKLTLNRITEDSGSQELLVMNNVPPGQLRQIKLGTLKDGEGKPRLIPGDILELALTLSGTVEDVEMIVDGTVTEVDLDITETPIFLRVNIVEEQVVPVPEAGYALLHRQLLGGQMQVECTRFAWNPPAKRVELICPDDLLTEVVRRRAVFHMLHTVRPGRNSKYAVQKITQSGSTHFPSFAVEL